MTIKLILFIFLTLLTPLPDKESEDEKSYVIEHFESGMVWTTNNLAVVGDRLEFTDTRTNKKVGVGQCYVYWEEVNIPYWVPP